MTHTPHTGFDPMDGEDERVTLSRDNPCAVGRREELRAPIDCHFCAEKPEIRQISVVYHSPRKTGLHGMFRAECRCGTIGKCRPTMEAAIQSWNEPWQARVGTHFLTEAPE